MDYLFFFTYMYLTFNTVQQQPASGDEGDFIYQIITAISVEACSIFSLQLYNCLSLNWLLL